METLKLGLSEVKVRISDISYFVYDTGNGGYCVYTVSILYEEAEFEKRDSLPFEIF